MLLNKKIDVGLSEMTCYWKTTAILTTINLRFYEKGLAGFGHFYGYCTDFSTVKLTLTIRILLNLTLQKASKTPKNLNLNRRFDK